MEVGVNYRSSNEYCGTNFTRKNKFTHQLQMSYLIQFGLLVGKNIGATCTMAPLIVVVIHKHKSMAISNKTPRLP
jgi:hypothetical protein